MKKKTNLKLPFAKKAKAASYGFGFGTPGTRFREIFPPPFTKGWFSRRRFRKVWPKKQRRVGERQRAKAIKAKMKPEKKKSLKFASFFVSWLKGGKNRDTLVLVQRVCCQFFCQPSCWVDFQSNSGNHKKIGPGKDRFYNPEKQFVTEQQLYVKYGPWQQLYINFV